MDGGLRSLFRDHLPSVHWVSIESPLTGAGIPDSNACHGGQEFWIEYKGMSGWRVHNMRPEQIGWIERRVRAGGRVFIAVRRHKAGSYDELWLFKPSAARLLLKERLDKIPLEKISGQWRGGPRAWDWAAILKILTGDS